MKTKYTPMLAVLMALVIVSTAFAAHDFRAKTDITGNVGIEQRTETETEVRERAEIESEAEGDAETKVFIGEHLPDARWLFRGFAVNVNDTNNFSVVRIGVTEDHGVLRFGDERLEIRNVTISDFNVKGDIYRDNVMVGSFDISKKENNEKVWSGTMTLDGQEYKLYLFGRKKPVETHPVFLCWVQTRIFGDRPFLLRCVAQS